MKKKSENRKFSRLKSYCLLRYKKTSPQVPVSEPALCNVKNISEGGILFLSKEVLVPATLIQVFVNLPSQIAALEATAKVVQCRKASGKAEGYNIGASFINLSDANRKAIRLHLETAAKSTLGQKLFDP